LRFEIEVHWNPDGLLEGEVQPVGAAAAISFWGIAELVGLLQTELGPATPALTAGTNCHQESRLGPR
jgi:hypothetical protein